MYRVTFPRVVTDNVVKKEERGVENAKPRGQGGGMQNATSMEEALEEKKN